MECVGVSKDIVWIGHNARATGPTSVRVVTLKAASVHQRSPAHRRAAAHRRAVGSAGAPLD